ncbi:MAG: hypothetical protein HGGPFJEG_02492 [Ignavibacteria bacterium]|nr:hypothetical protein [Ignavibacteria bacterium]
MLNNPVYKNFFNKIYKYRFYLLLISLLSNFFLPPFQINPLINTILKTILISFLILTGANFIKKDNGKLRKICFYFGLVNIILAILLDFLPENNKTLFAQHLLLMLFFIVITVNLIQQIFTIDKVTWDVIVGSFNGYILLGISSYFLLVLVEIANPGSLSGLNGNMNEKYSQIFYFAFVCLTTVGFGDILPTKVISQKICILTSVTGQLYIAVVVAILISRFLSHKKNSQP